jgi:hypothetical protein
MLIHLPIQQNSTLPHITTKYILIFQNAGPEDKTIDVNCDLGSVQKKNNKTNFHLAKEQQKLNGKIFVPSFPAVTITFSF